MELLLGMQTAFEANRLDPARRQERRDYNLISADNTAPANLPQQGFQREIPRGYRPNVIIGDNP